MIELKVKSENYIPKEEVEKILNKMEAEDMVCGYDEDLKGLLDKDFEVTIEIEEDDIVDAAKTQQCETELANELIPELHDDYIEEEYNDRALAKPLLASDFNSYDFKRQMCDFFETGYHVDSFDLVKLFAEKLKVDYLL